MFTGLVEEVGRIDSVKKKGQGLELTINAHQILEDIKVGDSIAIDGVCLTVEHFTKTAFSVQAVAETLFRSTLGSKSTGAGVNLERALLASARFGGHFVQGHVDGLAQIISIEQRDPGYWLTLRIPENISKFMVEKGSIALDGLSLTIARIESVILSVAIIPHTWRATTLKDNRVGDSMNIEVDILAKYLNKFIQPYVKSHGLTLDKLSQLGF